MRGRVPLPPFDNSFKLGVIVLSHEMQNAKCKMQNWDLSYGYHPPCHSERSRTKCGEVEESVLFTLFLGDGSFDSLRSLRMTVVVVTRLRRFKQSAKLKFEILGAFVIFRAILWEGRRGTTTFSSLRRNCRKCAEAIDFPPPG